jgi:predicted Zn-ribbon and HTH transcriptional regulator
MCLDDFAKELALDASKIHRAFHALSGFARSGFSTTPPDILATREATCRACPEWDATALNNTGRCRKCGCSTWAKLRMASERCPLGKWEAISSPSAAAPAEPLGKLI